MTSLLAFPSPCGVMGVKPSINLLNLETLTYIILVSVPLRGNGCETISVSETGQNTGANGFPSPCGVMGVKHLTFLRLTQ